MFRFETLLLAALLSSPVAALWLRGDFTDTDVWWRFALAWFVAWAAVALLTAAARPLADTPADTAEDVDDDDTDNEAPATETSETGPTSAG